jgi:uncharacterized membrane-anchored protein YitT (DUF2179 family)
MRKKYKGDRVDWATVRNPKHIMLILLGSSLAVLAMKGFMIPNRFLDGGVTGISILIHEVFHVNISLLVFSLNLIFVYLGYRNIGKTFAVQSAIATTLLSTGLYFIELGPITTDKLLIAIFGGILIGAGVGWLSGVAVSLTAPK